MGWLGSGSCPPELVPNGSEGGGVTLAGHEDQAGKKGHAEKGQLEGREIRPGDLAGEGDRLPLRLLEHPDAPPDLTQAYDLPRKGVHGRVGEAPQSNHEERAASLYAMTRDLERQVAAPRDQAEPPRHGGQSSRAGRQIGRLASSARMKSITSRTGALWP